MIDLVWLIPLGALAALVFSLMLVLRIFRCDEGTPRMKEIANAVREGASAYLQRQYRTITAFFTVVFIILFVLAASGHISHFYPFAFLMGGFFSALAGFCGMKIATHSSARTANACRKSLNQGLRVAFSAGSVMGFVVVGFGLMLVYGWFYGLNWYYDTQSLDPAIKLHNITNTLLCLGMGGSFIALFARVGGGIFTKAADVGADLVGKVEADIPEDDPRNPATIADNVGDNVGDVAGMGADLFDSYICSIIATMVLGVSSGLGMAGMTLPMILAAVGIFASIIGTFFVQAKENATQKGLLHAIHLGIFVSSALIFVSTFFVVRWTLGTQYMGISWAIVTGLIAGLVLGLVTEYFTSQEYRPTKGLSESALTGAATVIIGGISLGMLSSALPILVVAFSIIFSFFISGGFENLTLGIYGISIAAVGMLSTLGITLATDAYGPVADNAGGNAQMAGLEPQVRHRTDALDALGNTTAATGKGFAIGSAALTALALIAAYKENIIMVGGNLNLDLMNPLVLVGILLGTMVPYLFCALAMQAVGRAASQVVIEVRRQFKEIPGIMQGKAKPEYGRCVGIVTQAALKEMILPSMIAFLSPLLVGFTLGVNAIGGFLIGSTASGFVLAIMMANSGGAWDNAKKYIEGGHHGGKGSLAHKAAIVGDTVGDPFKDTAGPSINILIKMMSIISTVFAGFILTHALVH